CPSFSGRHPGSGQDCILNKTAPFCRPSVHPDCPARASSSRGRLAHYGRAYPLLVVDWCLVSPVGACQHHSANQSLPLKIRPIYYSIAVRGRRPCSERLWCSGTVILGLFFGPDAVICN